MRWNQIISARLNDFNHYRIGKGRPAANVARPEGLARRKEHSFHSEFKIPNSEFEMARRKEPGRVWGMATSQTRIDGKNYS